MLWEGINRLAPMSKPCRFPTSRKKTKKEGKDGGKDGRGLDNREMAVAACVNMMT